MKSKNTRVLREPTLLEFSLSIFLRIHLITTKNLLPTTINTKLPHILRSQHHSFEKSSLQVTRDLATLHILNNIRPALFSFRNRAAPHSQNDRFLDRPKILSRWFVDHHSIG